MFKVNSIFVIEKRKKRINLKLSEPYGYTCGLGKDLYGKNPVWDHPVVLEVPVDYPLDPFIRVYM